MVRRNKKTTKITWRIIEPHFFSLKRRKIMNFKDLTSKYVKVTEKKKNEWMSEIEDTKAAVPITIIAVIGSWAFLALTEVILQNASSVATEES